jgi:YjjG family noncanonical pyrimidine nucleotidase
MSYDVYLFDADDTLFDFQKSQEKAFHQILEKLNIVEDSVQDYDSYCQVNKTLWSEFEKNNITKDHLRVHRFKPLSEKYNLSLDLEEISSLYLNFLAKQVNLIKGASELLEKLSHTSTVGIITNGIGQVQRERLINSGFSKFVSFMVVSEECGFAKPDPRFFQYTYEKLRKPPLSTILVIGDRLETDIQGANDFQVDSCWFNPHNYKNKTTIKPTFTIDRLSRIPQNLR